jgi:Major tropism determinant N-terminal domain
MSIQIRRGLAADRATITPAEGELIYTTDTKIVYVGDGTTLGGNQISNTGGVSGNLSGDIALNSHNIVGAQNLTINGTTGAITAAAFSGVFNGSLGTDLTINSRSITNGSNLTINGSTGAITASSFSGAINGSLGADLLTQSFNITNGTNLTINGSTGRINSSIFQTTYLTMQDNRLSCTGTGWALRLQSVTGNAADGAVVCVGSTTLDNGLVIYSGANKAVRVYGTTDGNQHHPYIEARVSRGTQTSPTAVNANDNSFSIRNSIYDGSGSYSTVSAFELGVGSSVASTYTSGKASILVRQINQNILTYKFDEYGIFTAPVGFILTPTTAQPGSPVTGTYYTADGVSWDPASKGTGKPYPVFYDGTTYHSLY